MTLKTDMAADLTNVFFNTDEFAESISYTPKGGAAATIKVILSDEDATIQSPTAPGDHMVVVAQYTDIATPQRGDTFTINSITWYFVEIVLGGRAEGLWHIRVSRSARPSERAY